MNSRSDGSIVSSISTTARPAAAADGKNATSVDGSRPATRSRSVASTITARAPSDPTSRRVRSSPATFLRVVRAVCRTLPSARTTVRAAMWSPVSPYFRQQAPPALVAMLPPMVEMSPLEGSGGYQKATPGKRRGIPGRGGPSIGRGEIGSACAICDRLAGGKSWSHPECDRKLRFSTFRSSSTNHDTYFWVRFANWEKINTVIF
jgi:hypothetical protein